MNKKFTDYFKDLLDKKTYNAFIFQLNKKSEVSKALRINTLLCANDRGEISEDFKNLKKIPWSDTGYFYESAKNNQSIGNTQSYKDGKVYSQEASSQIAAELLDAREGDYILDLCASPGSKTTHIAAKVNNNALIIANEITSDRYVKLRNNLRDFGVVCHGITSLAPKYFAKNYPNTFDRILVDAPCSGEGMYFKFPVVLEHWNMKTVKFNARRQRKILLHAFEALKPGGKIVYSTCTLNLEENEKVIADLLKIYFGNAEIVSIDMKKLGLYKKGGNYKVKEPMLKLWPHEYNTGGFFVCVLTKNKTTEEVITGKNSYLTSRQRRQSIHKKERVNVREGWKLCQSKERMSIIAEVSKQLGVDIEIPRKLAIVKKNGEYFLQHHSFYKRFVGLPLRSAGIRIMDGHRKHTNDLLRWMRTL